MMKKALTRRQFLKLILASTVAARLTPVFHARAAYPLPPAGEYEDQQPWVRMGRPIHTVTFYEEASLSAKRLATRARDQGFEILAELHAPYTAHNDLWYQTPLGYVPSAWVLPVRVYGPQPFISDVGAWGFWGEVAQIVTVAYAAPNLSARQVYRFYGGTVYHVIAAYQDEQGTGWYQVYDEYPPTSPSSQWVLAKDIRRLPRAELAPLHPFVGAKRIEVELKLQQLTCYEGERPVFSTRVASGLPGETATPLGNHVVRLKQPSRHMSNLPYPGGPEPLGDPFDLPGVPWNTFFDLSGTAIHGTYWHNDFGIPRSHGCLNVSTEAAHWIYRWVYPIGGYEDDFIRSDGRVGTPILIR